jgi:hypothetical protein
MRRSLNSKTRDALREHKMPNIVMVDTLPNVKNGRAVLSAVGREYLALIVKQVETETEQSENDGQNRKQTRTHVGVLRSSTECACPASASQPKWGLTSAPLVPHAAPMRK